MVTAGTRLGHYEVLEPLGKGGMGEVWLARDTQLKRDVAIKVLPEIFAANPERLLRFQREAEVLASLDHPNIARVYGLYESDGVRAIVMEYVEGATLAERIARGPLPLDEALPIARQVAEAFEAAHEKGVIHRDWKPANGKIKPDGTVKVLDFGLAKALESGPMDPGSTHSPTMSLAATQQGIILGTAAYMAPEQARGAQVDRRCDIWSFGVVLFEMLTGKQMFGGDSVSDILASVLKSEPDWNALPPDTPASIRTLLRRCLNRDPSAASATSAKPASS
jgi:serine/threonine protein kinase